MKIRRLFTLVILIGLFLSVGNINAYAVIDEEDFFEPVNVHDGVVLDIGNCVGLAFQNSPKIRRTMYNLQLAQSNVGVAKSQFFPVIGAGVGFYNENNSNTIYYDRHYRDLPSVSVTLNQLIWDFGKTTANIKMEEFYKIGAEYEFMDSLCMTLFEVKAKYYALLKAKALLNIAKNNVEINEKFVEICKKHADVDYLAALVNLNDAKIHYIEAKNNVENAKVDLTNSMYIDSQPNYDISNTQTFTYNDNHKYGSGIVEEEAFKPYKFPFAREDAVKIAYENSPDLQVLISTKNAMIQNLKYIKRIYFPALTGNVGYGYNNNNIMDSNNSLQIGVNLSSTVNLMELKHSISGADAQLKLADNEIKLFKKDLYYEVKRAFNNVDRAQAQIPTTREAVITALKGLKAAENYYDNQTLSYTSLQIGRKDYIEALNNYVESIYNYNISLIQVEMAMHYHLVDIHHKSEHAVHYHAKELEEHLNKVLECDEREVKNSKKNKKFKRK